MRNSSNRASSRAWSSAGGRLNALLEPARGRAASRAAKSSVEQATASVNQMTRERFATAQTMLEKELDRRSRQCRSRRRAGRASTARDPDGLVRAGRARAAEAQARATLERAMRARPQFHSGARDLLPLPQRDQPVRRKPGGLREGTELRSVERRALLPASASGRFASVAWKTLADVPGQPTASTRRKSRAGHGCSAQDRRGA